MTRQDSELPYFDELCNEFVREVNRQDAYIRRGGKLTAPQMIKYENRIAMLVERLFLVLEAIQQEDPGSVQDYLQSIESTRRQGSLPLSVYKQFMDRMERPADMQPSSSERERDRNRVIRGEVRGQRSDLSELPPDELLKKYKEKDISKEVLFQEFRKREKAGVRLQRLDADLWGMYRSWLAEKHRRRRSHRRTERP